MKESEQQQIFNNWLGRYKALLFKVVRAYAFTAFDRDDLFQEISLQVWRSIPQFRQEAAVSTWLYRVSLNTAMRWSVKERKYTGAHEPIDSPAGNPSEARLRKTELLLEENNGYPDERLAWLYEEIGQLGEVDRSLTLLLLDGLSYKDMADVLGLTESNIGVRIHRIKKHLITQSAKYEYHGI